jgi:hypothetical protein
MHTEKKGFCARAASGSDRTGALTDAVERQQKKEKKLYLRARGSDRTKKICMRKRPVKKKCCETKEKVQRD